jgi:hypothetical protein
MGQGPDHGTEPGSGLEDKNMAKAAILVLSDMERREGMGRVLTALEATKELKDKGGKVELIFDGAGTTSVVAIAHPEHDLYRLYTQIQDQVTGLCRLCARAFGVFEEAERVGLTFLAEYDQHPSMHRLLEDGNEFIIF